VRDALRELLLESRNYLSLRARRGTASGVAGVARLAAFGGSALAARLLGRARPARGALALGSAAPGSPGNYFFEDADVAALAAHARRHHATEVEAVLELARAIEQGVVPLPSGDSWEWRAAAPGNPWLAPAPDPEHVFSRNRFVFGEALAKAFAYTADERFARAFLELLESWCRWNGEDTGSPAWESYSVSERIATWIFADRLLASSAAFAPRGRALLREALALQARHLSANLESGTAHNHLIHNARALFTWGTLAREPEAPRTAAAAWAILEREAARQLDPDGVLREQSSHYQLLLTRTYVEVHLLAGRNGRVSPGLDAAVGRMIEASAAFVRPDGTIAHVGDTSPDIESRPLVGMVALGERLLLGEDRTPLTEHAIWRGGARLLASGAKPAVGRAPVRATALRASGFAFAELAAPRAHLTLHASGDVTRHGHDDVLGFELWVEGRAIVADPGNDSYRGDAWTRWFHAAAAHSTIQLDGVAPSVPARYRRLFGASAALGGGLGVCRADEREAVLEAFHDGYRRLPRPVRLHRRLVLRAAREGAPAHLLVRDRLLGRGWHEATRFFQLGPLVAREVPPVPVVRGGAADLAPTLAIETAAGERLGYALFPGVPSVVVRRGWWSPRYGRREPGTTVLIAGRIAAPAAFDAAFWLSPLRPEAVSFD
jgi:hypothetical protein